LSEQGKTSRARFRLFEDAEKGGIFTSDEGWLVAAPTSTGKSYIGIEAIKRQLPSKPRMECFVYLVPFKALAEEMYTKIKKVVPPETRVHIKTGDYDKPFQAKETDVLVATYESLDGMVQEGVDFYPTLIVADEFSIIADETRGARIEALVAFLAKQKEGTKLFALSAVLNKPEELAAWLGLKLLKGTEKHRPVPLDVECVKYSDKLDTVRRLLKEGLDYGSVVIFCYTKKSVEKACDDIKDLVLKKLSPGEEERCRIEAQRLKNDFDYLVKPPELVPYGVAYHHAGLEVGVRNRIAELFEQRVVRVVAATTTVGAGVNMPARYVIIRDVFRDRRLLPVSVAVNMLGRAGRPPYDSRGTGYFMVDKERVARPNYSDFIDKVLKREIEPIESKIPASTSNILGFILSTAARMKGVTRDELASVYNTTLAGSRDPLEVPLPSKENLLANIEKLVQPPKKPTKVDQRTLRVSSGTIQINGGSGGYLITMSEKRSTCGCWDWKRHRGIQDCKHIEQLRYEAITGPFGAKNSEARAIAIAAFKGRGLARQPMYMISQGIELLMQWEFLAEKEGKLHITSDGRQALVSYRLDMEHVRRLRDTIRKNPAARDENDVIKWAIGDFGVPALLADQNGNEDDEDEEEKDVDDGSLDPELEDALWKHIENVPYKKVVNQSNVVRFLDAKETLEQIFGAYLTFVNKDDKRLGKLIRVARNRVHYGCTKELLPLMVLELEAVSDPLIALKLNNEGITKVQDLVRLDYESFWKTTGVGPDACRRSIEQANSIARLVSEFSGLRSDLNRLAAQTEVKIDDLFDYLLPPDMVDRLRK
jgi:superfamily II DNA/RNA helicase